MTQPSIEQRVREVLRAQGSVGAAADHLAVDADLYRAGLTSLGLVDLMLAMEQAFGVEFPEEALNRQTFASIRAIEAVVAGLLPGRAA